MPPPFDTVALSGARVHREWRAMCTWRWNMSFSMSIPATLSERIGSPNGERMPARTDEGYRSASKFSGVDARAHRAIGTSMGYW